MKRAKSIFLWCGELVEQWRGWLPHWGFSAKWVLTFSNKHHHPPSLQQSWSYGGCPQRSSSKARAKWGSDEAIEANLKRQGEILIFKKHPKEGCFLF